MAQRPRTDLFDLPIYADRLTQLADMLQQRGNTLAYHHHMMQPVETADQINALMQATGSAIKLLLDTGHLALVGDDYAPVMRRWWDRIAHIHLKDIRQNVLEGLDPASTTFNAGVRQGMFTVPGDGHLDFAPLAQQIAEHGYDGWLLVEAEQDPNLAPAALMANLAFDHLYRVFKNTGLTLTRNALYAR